VERALRDKLVNGSFGDVSETHSRRMGAIRGKGNRTTEEKFRGMLVRAGIRGWTMQTKHIKGKPDFYFSESMVAVFLDGCFWHGCARCGHVPGKNRPFWKAKIERNRQRDRDSDRHLREIGVTPIRFWEHELAESPGECIRRLRSKLGGGMSKKLP
jgi:DNA mismatch endonuclease (patch repair protein)